MKPTPKDLKFEVRDQSIGSISIFEGTEPPDCWMFCDGRTLSRDLYPELFKEIGFRYTKSNDDNNLFQIPDRRSVHPDQPPKSHGHFYSPIIKKDLSYIIKVS